MSTKAEYRAVHRRRQDMRAQTKGHWPSTRESLRGTRIDWSKVRMVAPSLLDRLDTEVLIETRCLCREENKWRSLRSIGRCKVDGEVCSWIVDAVMGPHHHRHCQCLRRWQRRKGEGRTEQSSRPPYQL